MTPIVVLASLGVAAISALVYSGRKLPAGQNPFDAFPPGVDGSSRLGSEIVTGSSRRRYVVTWFPGSMPGAPAGVTYYVAETKGDVDWISYFLMPDGSRRLWAANADNLEDVETMKRDFEVTSGAAP